MNSPQLYLRSKFPEMGTNIFTVMNGVAKEHGAINLAQGFPSFDAPAELIELVTEAFRSGRNQYAPMPGLPELRSAISDKIQFLYGTKYDSDSEVTVTPGGHAALMSAATAILHPGDEVILFEPCFDCFEPIIRLCGAKPVPIQLRYPSYQINWSEVAERITPQTRLIWINTPHNPTGTVLTVADMQELTRITRGTKIVVLSDEVYEHMVFDGSEHQSVCRFPELRERSFAIFSFGKVYHATGWKIGYVVAPRDLMNEFRKIHQMITFTTNHPVQWGLAQYLKNRAHYLELPQFYQSKRDFFLERLKGSRFDFVPTQGSYFQSLCYRRISTESEMDAAIRFAREARVASIPVSAFYRDPIEQQVLRFCFAKSEGILEQAATALTSV